MNDKNCKWHKSCAAELCHGEGVCQDFEKIEPNKAKAVPVKCHCGWRSKRVRGECNCYDEHAMNCACAWGYCKKCGGRVYPTDSYNEARGESHG